MRIKALSAAALCAVAVAAVGAGSALAGEVTGNGKTLWTSTIVVPGEGEFHTLHGKSICAFSGLNDEFIIDEDANAPRTQSWGQDVRTFAPTGGHVGVPGTACNPTKGFEE